MKKSTPPVPLEKVLRTLRGEIEAHVQPLRKERERDIARHYYMLALELVEKRLRP